MTTTEPTELRKLVAEALMAWAERNNDPQYAPMRRSETVHANAYSRADAVLAVLPELRTLYDTAVSRLHERIRQTDTLTEGRDALRRALAESENIRENAAFHMGQEMARRQAAEKETSRLREEQEAHRLALSEALGLGTGAPWDAIHDRARELTTVTDSTKEK